MRLLPELRPTLLMRSQARQKRLQQKNLQPKREWVGWMAVSRVHKIEEGRVDVAGRLVDMDEMDRGMLGLYLSTQPLAA